MTRATGGAGIPKQAMVLAAGQGLRMLPLTEDRAKPALPLMNRPLLMHTLDFLARHGVTMAVVNLHARPETLTSLLDGGIPPGIDVVTSFEPLLLGTGGGIRAALHHFDGAAPLLVVNADSLAAADLPALAAAHAEAMSRGHRIATLAVKPRELDEVYSTVRLDPRREVCGIGDAGSDGEPSTFIGLHIVTPEAVERLPASGPSEIVRDVYLPHLRAGGRLGAFRHEGWWVEAGNPSLYRRAHLRLLREAEFLAALPAECGARLAGDLPSFVGRDVEGVDGARIEESVVGPGARIGPGARVSRSVLGSGARIGAGARITDSIVWEGVEIPERTTVSAKLVMRDVAGPSARREIPLP